MPVALTYPGVYIEEVPSGVRTITGVADVDHGLRRPRRRGPDRRAGHASTASPTTSAASAGSGSPSPMSYAVRDFFLNGGGQAIVVRVARRRRAPPRITLRRRAQRPADDLVLAASSPEPGATASAPPSTTRPTARSADVAAATDLTALQPDRPLRSRPGRDGRRRTFPSVHRRRRLRASCRWCSSRVAPRARRAARCRPCGRASADTRPRPPATGNPAAADGRQRRRRRAP